MFNSSNSAFKQSLSLSLFVTVIALTVISMKLRYFATILAIFALVLLGVVTPQELILGIDWKLIPLLIGSMMFAYVLRSIGVFRFLALSILKASKGSPTIFIIILSIVSWFLAIAVDEATSIIYVIALLVDIKKLSGRDVSPLVILAVLATNTGSMAMSIGNPIGIYLAFTVGLHPEDLVMSALPLSLGALFTLIITSLLLLRKEVKELLESIKPEKVEIVVTEFNLKINKRGKVDIYYGMTLLLAFLVTVPLSTLIASYLSSVY